VVEVAQRRERVLDDVVAGAAPHRGDQGDTAGVVLVLGSIEADVVRLRRVEGTPAFRSDPLSRPAFECGHVTVLTSTSVSRPTSESGR
jgi:hypothetical protein